MIPYYETPNGKLYHGDCGLLLPSFASNSIDLIVTDPPYGINLTKGYKSGDKELILGDDGFSVMVFIDELAREFHRLLMIDSACYVFTRFDVFPYWWLKLKNYLTLKNQIIWAKGGGGMGDLKGNFAFDYESIIFAAKGKPYIRGKRDGSVWQIKKCNQTYHETQKPIILIKKLIAHSSDENSLILDPYFGSGTTAIACERLNRRWIGIEISEEYCKIAKQRITQEIQQTKMF